MSTITKEEVLNVLINVLPTDAYLNVTEHIYSVGKTSFLAISFASSHIDINNVNGQKPQRVSLCLDLDTLNLDTQVFGGNGGGCIYRKPNLDNPKEKYLAMKREKVPFKRPKNEKRFVLSAIERFAKNWLKTLKTHRAVLQYQDLVDYDKLLK